ncbi:MAG: 50S ribosomal protein L25/general stress protein Ctc [Hyphomicrobium sp.]
MASEIVQIKATVRPRAGKGAARQSRRDQKVPAVIYGDARPAETINLDYHDLWRQVLKGHFTATVIDLDVEGKKTRVIPREVQVDPVKDLPLHVDFLRIGKDGIIKVAVPVRFVNEGLSPGLKRGGVLNVVRHEIEIYCPYDRIPQFFEINLEGLDIGRSIHISSIAMPNGIKTVIQGRDFTVATIAGAKKEEEAEATAAATDGAAAPGAAPAAGDAKAAAPAAGGKAAAPAAGGKAGAPAAGGKAPAAGGKAPAAAPAAKKK